MNFNELIKEKRKEKGMTQEKLAEELGVSKQTIANWENNRSKLQITDEEMINLIVSVLSVSRAEIIKSIARIDDSNENKTNVINYPFLPSYLENIKLSPEEIEIIFAMEYLSKEDEILFEENSNYKNQFIKKELVYKDYVEILGSGRNVLSTKNNIKRVLQSIDINLLTSIIRNNNLTSFNIQELSENDIYLILKKYEEVFYSIENNRNNLCFFKNEGSDYYPKYNTYDRYIEGTRIAYKTAIQNERVINKGILPDIGISVLSSYFTDIELISKEDAAEYDSNLKIYDAEHKAWERKMVEIRKLQDLYDSEKYPDIEEPVKPEAPKKQIYRQLNYKGILLKKFFEKMHASENKYSDFVPHARKELAPYLNKNISVFGTLALIEDNSFLFKSLYVNGNMIDHLWVYDFDKELVVGETYEIKGTVNIYTKNLDDKILKNYGIIVSDIIEV